MNISYRIYVKKIFRNILSIESFYKNQLCDENYWIN